MVGSTAKSGCRVASAAAGPYAAPALEKGLDILELLATQPASGLSQKGIADKLGRRPSEIFRMLVVLNRRGYVRRHSPADTYHLTARLFDLAHRHPPVENLLSAAIPLLQQVAAATRQSCHLAVREGSDVLMLAKADSPEPRGLAIRTGARFPLRETSSGRVLLAFSANQAEGRDELLEAIRRRGYERHRSATIRGIIDLSCPVLDERRRAVAAMTIPYLSQRNAGRRPVEDALARLIEAARQLSQAIGGEPAPFHLAEGER